MYGTGYIEKNCSKPECNAVNNLNIDNKICGLAKNLLLQILLLYRRDSQTVYKVTHFPIFNFCDTPNLKY